ncbi:MAG TPA: hypothetical protein VN690_12400 [Terriglobales bacterium]|nr:hypothetical protein [Terriglobales bacterium]
MPSEPTETSRQNVADPVPCPLCAGTGRLALTIPDPGRETCPACMALGEVAAEAAVYLARRNIVAAPLPKIVRRPA